MDWIFSIQAKLKAAFLLALICALVLVNIYWERSNISDINDSFCSIYDDRLLPATYIFHLTDHLYQKRLILEHEFHAQRDQPETTKAMELVAFHNKAMDTLITDFERTYLVELEGQMLVDFKKELQDYNLLEKKMLGASSRNLVGKSEQAGITRLFEDTLEELTLLSQIQIDVGRAMRDDSLRLLANTKVLTMLEAALIVVIALIIQALVFASRSVTSPVLQRHDLN